MDERRWFALAVAAMIAAPGAAQAQVSWTAAGELGGDDVNLLYTSVGWDPGWEGLRPTLGLSTYRVGYTGGETFSFGPSVGLEYRASGGSLEATAGYSFKNRDNDGTSFFGGSDNGLTSGLHAEYWGNGTWGLQGIVSHNWGSDYLWSRARATRRVASLRPGSVALGAELGWQGDTRADALGNRSGVTQYGPVLQWNTGGDWLLAASGGVKDIDGADDTWYGKLEVVFSPF